MSKAAAEGAALRLAGLHQLDLVVGRLGTCFGPWETDQRGDDSAKQKPAAVAGSRDTPSAPLQVLQYLNNPGGTIATIAVLPRPSRRDWLYVRDAAAALTALLDTPLLPSPVYNLSTGFIWSMQDWCAAVQARYPSFQWKMAAAASATTAQEAAPQATAEASHDAAAPTIDLFGSYDRAPLNIHRLLTDTHFVPRYDLTAAASDFLDWHARAGMPDIDH